MAGKTLADFANGDGTYDGAGFFAEISGLSRAEIQWTFDRLKRLMRAEGKSRVEALAIVREEARARPWEAGDAA